MVAGSLLHSAGVEHGQLRNEFHIVGNKGSLQIVDFTKAKAHECMNAYPDVGSGLGRDIRRECEELRMLERVYGRHSGAPILLLDGVEAVQVLDAAYVPRSRR